MRLRIDDVHQTTDREVTSRRHAARLVEMHAAESMEPVDAHLLGADGEPTHDYNFRLGRFSKTRAE